MVHCRQRIFFMKVAAFLLARAATRQVPAGRLDAELTGSRYQRCHISQPQSLSQSYRATTDSPLLTSRLFRSPLEARAAASARVHCKGGLNLYPCSFSWLIDRGGNERSPPHFSSLFPPSQLATRRVMHNRIGPCFCLSHTSRGNGAAQSCVRALSSRVAATLCSEYLHSRSSIHNWTAVFTVGR